MTKSLFILLSFIASAMICFVSCSKDDSPTAVEIAEPVTFRNAYYPLAVGNSWTYTDSIFKHTDTTVYTYNVNVTGFRQLNADIWWTFHVVIDSFSYDYERMEYNDTTFGLEYTDTPYGTGAIASRDYIPPPTVDSAYFVSITGGDAIYLRLVKKLNAPLQTPAGTFDSCAVYTYHIAEMHGQEIIRPRIGIVSQDIKRDSSSYGPYSYTKLKLVSYSLVH